MAEVWDTVSFSELYAERSRNGLTRPKRVRGSGYKMINMGEIFAHDRICNPPMERVPMNETEKRKYGVKAGDLLFARQSLVASGAGKCSIVLEAPEPTTFESHLIRVRLDQTRTDPLFYFYYFSSPLGKGNVQSLVMQVAAAGIRGSELAQLPVPHPPLPTQRKIAAILSAYDDLIENNARRIAALEEMARLIYREWFVHFRFPGHEGVEMVESELGSIPEGWEVVKLESIADVNASSIKKDKAPERINYVTISSVSTGRIEKIEPMAFEDAPSRARRIARHEDIIWSTVRPNRKAYCLVLDPVPDMIVSTGFAVITARNVPYTYLYHALTTDEFAAYLTNNATGAAYPAVNAGDFEKADILLPSRESLDTFHNMVVDLLTEKQNLHKKSEVLRRTRDLLLPRLISGEVDVSELEIEV